MPSSNPSAHCLRAHQFSGLAPGPRLIVLGAVHGNEVCGTRAIERLLGDIDQGRLTIERGVLTLVPVCNPMAYGLGRRQGDRNLNRCLQPTQHPVDFEDRVANVLCRWLADHDVLLDLHSFHTAGKPFAMIGPHDNTGPLEPFCHAGEELRMAIHLGPTRLVEGWLEAYARGTSMRRQREGRNASPGGLDAKDLSYGMGTTEYMRTQGGYGITLECGQHEDADAPAVAYHAILQTMALLGLTSAIALQPPARSFQLLSLGEVIDRLHPDDHFVREWESFDPVRAGQAIGVRHDGSVVEAPDDGHVVFPNPRAEVGTEWFYFARAGSRPGIPGPLG